MEPVSIAVRRLRFAALAAGQGRRLALLLHGFPDDARSLVPLASRFAAAGYRVLVPFLPGYPPSQPPDDGDYSLPALAADMAELMEDQGFDRAHILGHDWGALIGYTLACLAPERVEALVALSVPPLSVILDVARHQPAQLWRSWYALLFQLPHAEKLVRARNLAMVEWLWRRWSPGWGVDAQRIAETRATLRAPGALEAALGYYRALPRLVRPRDPAHRAALRRMLAPIDRPTLVLLGDRDGCIPPALYQGLDQAFSRPPSLCALTGAGHWLPLERPDEVASLALAFWKTLEIGGVSPEGLANPRSVK